MGRSLSWGSGSRLSFSDVYGKGSLKWLATRAQERLQLGQQEVDRAVALDGATYGLTAGAAVGPGDGEVRDEVRVIPRGLQARLVAVEVELEERHVWEFRVERTGGERVVKPLAGLAPRSADIHENAARWIRGDQPHALAHDQLRHRARRGGDDALGGARRRRRAGSRRRGAAGQEQAGEQSRDMELRAARHVGRMPRRAPSLKVRVAPRRSARHDAPMLDLVIRGATLVDGDERATVVGDLGVEAGRIVAIGQVPGAARVEVVAEGAFLLPGAIDVHVHLRSPGHPAKEDFATGTRAAGAGGITTVLDMPNTEPPTTSPLRLLEKRRLAQAAARVHFGLYLGATADNLDTLLALEDRGQPPVAVKAYLGASTGSLLFDDPGRLDRWLADSQTLLCVHAEDQRLLDRAADRGDVMDVRGHGLRRPPEAALAAVAIATGLAHRHGHPVHVCHLSLARELELLATSAAERPGLVTCEVTPHHLFLSDLDLEALGPLGKVNPPLRTAEDAARLREALAAGRIDCLGTDHAPHLVADKHGPHAPSGIPGLDTAMRLLVAEVLAGRLSWARLAAVTSGRPARRFQLVGKGALQLGADADLVLWRPGPAQALEATELHSRCAWSPWLGRLLPPPPEAVWIAGRLLAARGRIVDDGVRGLEVRTR